MWCLPAASVKTRKAEEEVKGKPVTPMSPKVNPARAPATRFRLHCKLRMVGLLGEARAGSRLTLGWLPTAILHGLTTAAPKASAFPGQRWATCSGWICEGEPSEEDSTLVSLAL